MRDLLASNEDNAIPKLELLATDTLLRLAHSLHGDYNSLGSLYPGWVFHREPMDIPEQLADAVKTGNISDFINKLPPQDVEYAKLSDAMATYRDYATKGPWPRIDGGGSLKLHDTDKRVAQLRARLIAEDYLPTTSSNKNTRIFDTDLEAALINYQSHTGLKPDGHLGGQTLATLNTPLSTRIDQIATNMERWRHMPDGYPGTHYAMVNIATQTLRIIDGDKTMYEGPVVIGRPDRRTPFINSTIYNMIINPSWHVPSDLGQKDILPKLRQDPTYLEKQGIVISDSVDDPYGAKIDWKHLPESEFNFRLRQVPGDLNSLGHVKFNFENPFSVYMHGTPHQDLFDKTERDFSSGCIRLRDPNDVAQVLTASNKAPWTSALIDAQVEDGKTKTIPLATPLPLSVVYWTVFPDNDGKVDFRKDIYGYDEVLAFIMKNHPKARIRLQLQPTEKDRVLLKNVMHPDESLKNIPKAALVSSH